MLEAAVSQNVPTLKSNTTTQGYSRLHNRLVTFHQIAMILWSFFPCRGQALFESMFCCMVLWLIIIPTPLPPSTALYACQNLPVSCDHCLCHVGTVLYVCVMWPLPMSCDHCLCHVTIAYVMWSLPMSCGYSTLCLCHVTLPMSCDHCLCHVIIALYLMSIALVSVCTKLFHCPREASHSTLDPRLLFTACPAMGIDHAILQQIRWLIENPTASRNSIETTSSHV